jgi:hypothetical protein
MFFVFLALLQMKAIEYGEYKEVLDVVQRENVEDAYQDLMKKENDVLTTVNNVVKYYRDKDISDGEFVNQSISSISERLVGVWFEVITDIASATSLHDVITTLTKNDHPIYLGITLVVIALFLFLIESSSTWTS